MIKKRLLPCVLIVVLTVGCVVLSRPTRILFFLALAVASAFEMENVLAKADMPVSKWYLAAYIVLQGALCWLRVSGVWMIALFGMAAFGLMLWSILCPEQKGARFAAASLFALMWPFGFYAVVLHAAASEVWIPVLSIAILGAWACDCMALLGGKAFGKRKCAPHVSPNKTWAGCIVGAVSAILAGYLIWLLIRSCCDISAGLCMVTAFIASTFGQFGDLAASLIKRMAGVKDYSNLLPEHGGIMDKTDSVLFAIPAAYLCLFVAGVI